MELPVIVIDMRPVALEDSDVDVVPPRPHVEAIERKDDSCGTVDASESEVVGARVHIDRLVIAFSVADARQRHTHDRLVHGGVRNETQFDRNRMRRVDASGSYACRRDADLGDLDLKGAEAMLPNLDLGTTCGQMGRKELGASFGL